MPKSIQSYAQGLFDLLNIKAGSTLEEIKDDLQGTIDCLDIYALQQLETTGSTSATIAAANNAITFEVPQQELWFVYGYSTQLTLPDINDSTKIALQFRQNALFQTVLEGQQATATVAGEVTGLGITWPRPMLFKPGDQLVGRFRNVLLNVAPSAVATIIVRVAKVGPETKVLTL